MSANRGAGPASENMGDGGTVSGHTRTKGWRSIRVRMMLPIAVATLGVIVLGVLRTADAVTIASQAERARALASASGQIVTLAHDIGQEFVQTNYALRQKSLWSILDDEIAATDTSLRGAREGIATIRQNAPGLDALAADALRPLDGLAVVRQVGKQVADGSDEVFSYYDGMMRALLALADAVPAQLNDPHLVQLAQSLALIGQLDRLAILQLDVISRAINAHTLRPADAEVLPEWIGEERTRVEALLNLSPAGQMYSDAMGTAAISNATSMRKIINDSRDSAVALSAEGDVWLNGQTSRIDLLTSLRTTFTGRLVSDADALGQGARNSTSIVAGLSGLLVAVTVVTATLLAVRTSRRLRRTREAALTAARIELPTAIANVIASRDETMVKTALSSSSARVDAMLIPGPDEIGELAAAFGGVHRQALRLAADQALLRMEVQAMFVALSRRGQTLVQRQIHLIDEFGRGEADPDALSRLFALDHLAARMRRNEENLLVLAGGEPGRWITRPVAMADLLRAAAQEIEEYKRVKVVYAPEIAVSAQVAGDAIHLLAELMENATTFSPPNSVVRVSAHREAEGMTITVQDDGIGMPPDKLAEANERLGRPSALTSNLVGTMGLLVVARLAERHRLVVRLASQPATGTSATVVLPDRVLTPLTAGAAQANGFTRELTQANRELPVPAAASTTLPRSHEAAPTSSAPITGAPVQYNQPTVAPYALPHAHPPQPPAYQPVPYPSASPPAPNGPAWGQPAWGEPARPEPARADAGAAWGPPSTRAATYGAPPPGPAGYGPPTSAYPQVPDAGPYARPTVPHQREPLSPVSGAPPAGYYSSMPPRHAMPPTQPDPGPSGPGAFDQSAPPGGSPITASGLPRRPESDLWDTNRRDLNQSQPPDMPDPDAVRARLSSLSQGIAAASHHTSAPPTYPR